MSSRRKPGGQGQFHGGDLADAAASGGSADADWIDLSTGINPNAWPVPDLPENAWTRLPGRAELAGLLDAAATYYGARDGHLVAGPGSQALIQALPACLPEAPATIVAPTYGGHAPAWAQAGRKVRNSATLDGCPPDGIAVLTNPNNPDGRLAPRGKVVKFADTCTEAGGWLVVDEAFCDLAPEANAAPDCGARNLVVIRSFGKFFGLAGLRLGFAIGPRDFAERLRATLGPWAVSGPAIRIGTKALGDTTWQAAQREALAAAAARLDALLERHGLGVTGGTALFRLVRTAEAPRLYTHLIGHGIYVRRFPDRPDLLRFGLPGPEAAWDRLAAALESFGQ